MSTGYSHGFSPNKFGFVKKNGKIKTLAFLQNKFLILEMDNEASTAETKLSTFLCLLLSFGLS